MKTLLNSISTKHGSYTAEGNKIRRTFFNRFSYIAAECKSEQEANRITNQLNQIAQND
jgi:hypothetical protein